MRPVVKHLLIQAPMERVWAALTNSKDIAAWMEDASATFDPQEGGKLGLFGGSTTGTVTQVEAPHALEYTWRQAEWPRDWEDSIVRWSLQSAGEMTLLRLTHTGFPSQAERDSHDSGWDEYWLGPMQEWLEANSQPTENSGAEDRR